MISRFVRAAAVFLLVAVCSFNSLEHGAGATKPLADTRKAAAIASGGSWTTYHHDNAHTANDPSAPAVTSVGVTPGWTETPLDGEVYAEPLIYNGIVYTATLMNTVYALRQSDGVELWHRTLGAPKTGGWVCGNVSPQGILGTPVIDTAGGRVYVAALFSDSLYRVYGLDLATGAIGLTTVIPASIGTGFDWKIQQQRGALALANGYVYVPFGGRAGDCFNRSTPYYGWVVGVPTDGSSSLKIYQTPSGAESVWAAGGVVVDDTSHNVYFATGNAIPCAGSTYSDAIVRVSPTLATPTFFEPNDWQSNWCSPDSDLGSASPLLISPTLMFTAGKRGGGFLLDPTNLGGVDGQLFPTPKPAAYSQAEACLGQHANATFGSFAYAAPFVYVECEGHGLVALQVNPSTRSFVPCPTTCGLGDWHAQDGATFGPPIVAGGAVWAATNGGGLYAFNASTGVQIFKSANFGINRFVTPAEAGGQVFVPSHTVIKSFSFGTPVSPNDNQGHIYTLDGYGGLHADGIAPSLPSASYWAGWNIARSVALFPDSQGGYLLDGYGGIHAVGNATPLNGFAYWGGWDIARQVVMAPWSSRSSPAGWTLDGLGGVHAFGGAPEVGPSARWNWDIARSMVILPDSTPSSVAGYTLDGYGGVHPFGGAPAISNNAYFGWDIARGFTLAPAASRSNPAGWTVDGYGGVHPFGSAPAYSNYARWGWDIGRGIVAWNSGTGGWVLDGWGGIHPFGSAPDIPGYAYWPGWDIATSMAGANFGTGSMHR